MCVQKKAYPHTVPVMSSFWKLFKRGIDLSWILKAKLFVQ